MSEREKKIAEIREALEKIDRGDYSEIGKAHGKAGEWLRFLLFELDREREENRKLREERDDLIEGIKVYAEQRIGSDDDGEHARDILREIGVTVE